jgi:hypothetical protein
MGGGAATGGTGWGAATCRGAPRVWGCGSGRLGSHSGARGVHPRRQHSREGAAMAGVGHGAGAGVAPLRVTVGIGEEKQGEWDKDG